MTECFSIRLGPPRGLGERWAVPELHETHFEWIRSLPETIDWLGFHFTHAVPGDDAENWLDHKGPQNRLVARDRREVESRAEGLGAAVILTGHTHTPRMVRLSGGRIVVNPGGCRLSGVSRCPLRPSFSSIETGAPDAALRGRRSRSAPDYEVSLRIGSI